MTRFTTSWAPYADLFSRRARVKLGIATLGSLVVSLVETAAIALLFPLIQILSGADMEQGVLGWLHQLLGQPAKIPFILTLMSGEVRKSAPRMVSMVKLSTTSVIVPPTVAM